MKAIVELTESEYKIYSDINAKLNEAKTLEPHVFETIRKTSGHAHYKFTGKLSDAFINTLGRMPTPTEVIMLVDNGFSHFGASCSLQPDGTFTGRVNTD